MSVTSTAVSAVSVTDTAVSTASTAGTPGTAGPPAPPPPRPPSPASAAGPAPIPVSEPEPDAGDDLVGEVVALAGQIAAATSRYLALLARLDAAGGWVGPGIRSCAHWLSWRCGTDLRTARDHVRTARALAALPRTAAAFDRGTLSYSKVRALARVATPDTEADLVRMALASPAGHLERLCAGLRRLTPRDPHEGPDTPRQQAQRAEDARAAAADRRRLRWRWDPGTGDLVLQGRLAPADGAAVLAALTRADHDRLRTDHDRLRADRAPAAPPRPAPVDGSAEPCRAAVDGSAEPPDLTGPPPADLAPALLALAERGLAGSTAPVHAPAAELVLHRDLGDGTVSVADGPPLDDADADAATCSATVRAVTTRGGAVLAWGRARRRPTPAQLRALHHRDRGCAAPGCARTRHLHAHHVTAWQHGGPTDLDNLLLLCGTCHRDLHHGRFSVTAHGRQRFTFTRDGRAWPAAPPTAGDPADLLRPDPPPDPLTPRWDGGPLDLSYATDTLVHNWALRGLDRTRRGTASAA